MTQGLTEMPHNTSDGPQRERNREAAKPVSLAPLKLPEALSALFAIPNPDATKPKRKKAPPTPDKE